MIDKLRSRFLRWTHHAARRGLEELRGDARRQRRVLLTEGEHAHLPLRGHVVRAVAEGVGRRRVVGEGPAQQLAGVVAQAAEAHAHHRRQRQAVVAAHAVRARVGQQVAEGEQRRAEADGL